MTTTATPSRLIAIDQALSSASNFLLVALVASRSSSEELGHFSVALAIYVLILGVFRATALEPGLVPGDGTWTSATARHRGRTAIGIAMAAVPVLTGVSVAFQEIATYTGPLAALLPLLLVQDLGRYRAFASAGTPVHRAVSSDALWLIGFLVTVVVGLSFFDLSAPSIFVAWLIWGATAGVAIGRPRSILADLRTETTHRVPASRVGGYLGEFVASTASAQLTVIGVATLGSAQLAGSWRLAMTYFGPVTVLNTAAFISGITQHDEVGPSSVTSYLRRCLPLAATSLTWAVIGYGPASGLIDGLLGQTWSATRHLIIPVGGAFALGSFVTIGRALLRADARTLAGLGGMVAFVLLTYGTPLVAVAFGGGQTALGVGFLCGAGVSASIWIALTANHLR